MNIETVIKFGGEWELVNVVSSRVASGCSIDLLLTYTNKDNKQIIELSTSKDYGIVESLLESEWVVFSKETNSQREFGTVHVACHEEESYSEYWCDKIEIY